MAKTMIPFIWLRLIAVICFGIFMAIEAQWIVAAIAAALAALSAFQLFSAYKTRAQAESAHDLN